MKDLITNDTVLRLLEVAIFVGGFIFATAYLLPRSFKNYALWKERKNYKKLMLAIEQFAAGIFLLMILFVRMI